MDRLMERLRNLETKPTLQLVMGLGGAIVLLVLIGIIGAITVGDDGGTNVEAATGASNDDDASSSLLPEEDPGAAGETTTTAAAATTKTTAKAGAAPKTVVGGSGIARNDAVSTQGATRVGVTSTEIRWGLHAPETFDGAPLNLAEDPLKGVGIYLKVLNDSGGVHGRKIVQKFADDRYTVEGGQTAGKKLINDDKVFFLSGALGVDQIAQVAKLAREAKPFAVPYMAGGGSEEPFKDIGMFQIAGSYDTHLIKLAQYLGKLTKESGSPYFGKTKVGVSRLDSPYIQPSVEKVFKDALAQNGLQLVKTVTVDKPTVQKTYATQILDLKGAGVQIFVPAQDPITTSRQVAECRAQACNWVYASSDFAHESDVALTLMQGSWGSAPAGPVYALAGGCYYLSTAANCGALPAARNEWVKAAGQADFNKDGQGGVAGYQIVHFWLKALRDIGPDPTREKLMGALSSYQGYNDLVGGPITHKGSANTAHGAEAFVKYRATNKPGPDVATQFTWEQISDGFVTSF
jgi:ABC-type branched-subunit amino acid transport system substrate-binding protein